MDRGTARGMACPCVSVCKVEAEAADVAPTTLGVVVVVAIAAVSVDNAASHSLPPS